MAGRAWNSLLLLLLFLLFLIQDTVSGYSAKDEEALWNDLLQKKAHKHFPPSKNESTPIQVSYGIALLNIDGVDERAGSLQLNVWERMSWTDEYLTWNPEDYNGTDSLKVPSDDLWMPDIRIYNSRDDTGRRYEKALVSSDGTVLFVPHGAMNSHCDLDATYYPFDIQRCSVRFGSWVYDGNTVDLKFWMSSNEGFDLSTYKASMEWTVMDTSSERQVKTYECCPEPYVSLVFHIKLRRQPSYYTYFYLGPAVILSLVAPFIFMLAPRDPQKLTLGVGVLICFSIYFLEISNVAPITHPRPPLIIKYYLTVYALVAISIVLSTLVSNVARRSTDQGHPPQILTDFIVKYLGRCLCICPTNYANLQTSQESGEMKLDQTGNVPARPEAPVGDWMLIAAVIDRLFFVVFLFLSVLVALILLTSYPRS